MDAGRRMHGGGRPPMDVARPRPGTAGAGRTGRRCSAGGGLQGITQRGGLLRRHLDDETAAPLQRDAHDDAAPLLGDLERTVTRPPIIVPDRGHGRNPGPPPPPYGGAGGPRPPRFPATVAPGGPVSDTVLF